MPELPEMEAYKTLLIPRLINRSVTAVEVTREKSVNLPEGEFIRQATAVTVTGLERRAKHLLFHLSSGRLLLLHLMLGGSMFWGTEAEKPDRSFQVRLTFGQEHLYFMGLLLGFLHLLTEEEADRRLAKLGPEPTAPDFTQAEFMDRLFRKRGRLKPTLVDQSFLSGIGNCYSDEICFAAGILPFREIVTLAAEDAASLYRSMRSVLAEATHHGGYMDLPLYTGDSWTGGFDERCRVYDREGEPCVRCGTNIRRRDVSGRKMFFCEVCQR